MNKKEVIVEKDKKTVTFLQDFGFSFADVNKMLRNKDVKVNGLSVKENIMLKSGDEVVFYYSDDMLNKKFDIVFEDESVLIVYKSAGIETAGDKGLEEVLKVFAVHRLDRNTEGLVVFAKNKKVQKSLENAFKSHKIEKFYIAEVVGKFDVDKQFDAYLVKDKESSSVKVFDKPCKNSVSISTHFKTLKSNQQSSLLEIKLLTGKTHQIRAHLAYLGHSIIGDGKYGKNSDNKKFQSSRQKLACFKMVFGEVGVKNLAGKTFERFPKWYCVTK